MSDAQIIAFPTIRPSRPLGDTERNLIARAVEAWAYRMRTEGRDLDVTGSRDEAHAYYRMADEAQAVLNTLPRLRVES